VQISTSAQPSTSAATVQQCTPAATPANNIEEKQQCRIINLHLLSVHIKDIIQHIATCSTCLEMAQSKDDSVMVFGETHHKGLASMLGCQFGCGEELRFATSTKTTGLTGKKYWTNNLAAVWGQMSVGGGFNSLEETMCILGIPVMTKRSFIHTECAIGKWWWSLLEESMVSAGREGKQIAIEKGQYHGTVPAITVIVDGGWCKRSHKHSYNALSGVGVIFGKETKKLLFIGVRNKFCSVCAKGHEKEHDCFKNWDGASSSLECDIIVEGFRKSEEQHGLRYTTFIGDGDSAVFSTLKKEIKSYGFAITKEECANHAVKCFRSALENLVKDKPQYKGRNKLTEAQRKRLATAVRCAIVIRSKQVENNELDKKEAAKQLQEDILNAALHCFGSHHKCKADYCKTVRAMQSTASTSSKPSHLPAESTAPYHEMPLGSDISMDSSSSFLSGATSSDISFQDSSMSSTSSSLPLEPPTAITIEDDVINSVLSDQQTAWEDTTADKQADDDDDNSVPFSLDPAVPLDHQMICDIQKLASRLVAKSYQLLGMRAQSQITMSTMCIMLYTECIIIFSLLYR